MPRKSSKDAILDALERVIVRQGMAGTTVEAVAAEAGVSKGGLFYHFPNKRDMLFQLMERYQSRYFSIRDEIRDSLPDTPNRMLKASLLASMRHPAKTHGNIGNVLSLMDDVELREHVLEMKQSVFREIADGSEHPERIALAFLAVDGLWLSEMCGDRFDAGFQQKIIEELLRLVDSLDASNRPARDAVPAGGEREDE